MAYSLIGHEDIILQVLMIRWHSYVLSNGKWVGETWQNKDHILSAKRFWESWFQVKGNQSLRHNPSSQQDKNLPEYYTSYKIHTPSLVPYKPQSAVWLIKLLSLTIILLLIIHRHLSHSTQIYYIILTGACEIPSLSRYFYRTYYISCMVHESQSFKKQLLKGGCPFVSVNLALWTDRFF